MTRRVVNLLPELPCACASLRRAARAVTRIYDRELRAAELELTQFTLLMTLDLTGETTQKRLAHILAMDSTTLSRTLRPLLKHGWVEAHSGKDQREKLVSLTAAGRRKFEQARVHWERAQEKLREAVGQTAWEKMRPMLDGISSAAQRG